jgi:hypothetical protein
MAGNVVFFCPYSLCDWPEIKNKRENSFTSVLTKPQVEKCKIFLKFEKLIPTATQYSFICQKTQLFLAVVGSGTGYTLIKSSSCKLKYGKPQSATHQRGYSKR